MPAQNQAELILLIEDDAGITELVKEKLEEHGKEVAHVSSGKAACAWLEHNRPQLILLDYSLPDQSGLELVEQIESMLGSLPPFIVTTGAGDEKIAVAMMKQGARDYVVKDWNFLETLPLAVEQVLKQLATEQKLAETERALLESETLNQAIISNSPIGISVRSRMGQLLSANAAWKKIWAIPDSDMREDMSHRRNALEFDRRDDYLLPHQAEIRRIYQDGGYLNLPELKTTHPRPGAAEWVSQHFYAIHNEQGQVDRVVILTEDVSERKRSEVALLESEERYHIIFEQAGDYTLLLEIEDGHLPVIVDANESALKAHGYSREELIGASISLIDPNISLATVSEIVTEIKKSGSLIFNTRHKRKGGTWLDVEVNTRLVRIGDKEFYLSVERNITERKQAEEKLRATTAQLETLIQVSPLAIIALDVDGNVQLWNDSAERIFGWSLQEVVGHPNPIVPPEKESEYTSFSQHVLNGEPLSNQEAIRLRKDGTLVPVSISSATMHDATGNVSGRMAIVTDITERKQAEEAIRASEEKYRLLFSDNPAPMWVYDTETLAFLAVNEFAIDLYGYSREEFLSMTIKGIRPPEDVPYLTKVLNTDMGALRKIDAVRHRKKDGSIMYVDIAGHAIEFEGKPAMLVLSQNITERIRAEEALRDREALYHQMFSSHTAVMLLIDPDSGLIVEANPAAANFYGYSPEELQQLTIQQINILPPKKVAQYRRAAASGQQNFFLFSHRLAPGEIRDVEVHSVPIHIEGRTLLYSIIHDITERKQAEDALLESEERFYKAFHASPVVMSISSLDDATFLDANAQFFKLTGLKREETIGKKSTELELLSPETRDEIFAELKETGFVHNKEVELITKTGQTVPLLWFGDVVHINNKPCLIVSGYDLTERKKMDDELKRQKSFFEQTFIQSATSTQILDKDGWCLRINPKLSELFGVKPEQIEGHVYNIFKDEEIKRQGIDTILERVYKEQKVEKWEVNFDIGVAADSQNIEVEQKKKVWYANKAYPIKDEMEKLTNVIIQHEDISERKLAEAAVEETLRDKEVLLRELYHRTKNNMQVISSMLNLELDQIKDENLRQPFYDMDSRIRSMALVHQKLYHSQNLSSLDLKDYIADLVSLMLESYQVKPGRIGFDFQGESIPVLIDTAIPCGLIINEILSNALKYAFPGDKKGNIKIYLERKKDATIILEISDDGVGVPHEKDLRQSNTLGMQTIFGIARHQLGAKVELETNQGVSWRIQFTDNLYLSRV